MVSATKFTRTTSCATRNGGSFCVGDSSFSAGTFSKAWTTPTKTLRSSATEVLTTTFTFVHVLISLVGIGSGFVVIFGLLAGKRLNGWTGLFLTSTVATSVTGFLFPFDHLLPSHKVGLISLVVLAVAILARYAFHLTGAW